MEKKTALIVGGGILAVILGYIFWWKPRQTAKAASMLPPPATGSLASTPSSLMTTNPQSSMPVTMPQGNVLPGSQVPSSIDNLINGVQPATGIGAVSYANQQTPVQPTVDANGYPIGANLKDGMNVISDSGAPAQYLLQGGKKRYYSLAYWSNVLGYRQPTKISDQVLHSIPDGDPLDA